VEIVPYYGDQQLSVSSVQIRINPEDRKRARALLTSTADINLIADDEGFTKAKHALGQLKALLNEIEVSKKSVKQPFDAVINSISETAKELWDPVINEHRRIQELLNEHVKTLEAKRKNEERERREVQRRIQQEQDRKIHEAHEAQRRAEEQARLAQDEAARQKAKADAAAQQLLAVQEQLAKELAIEASNMFESGHRGFVSGGRVDHNWEFKLTNVEETIRAGSLRLLRYEIDFRACQDACKKQLELDPNCEPTLPGIEVTRKLNVSVKARS
jgi:hypothetical protein